MKLSKYILLSLFSTILWTSCSDDDEKNPGNPVMDIKSEFSSAMFGDSLPFKINVSDEVPLSTLKARVYYGEEMVSEVVLRTKTEGEYNGKVYIPFLKDIPNGTLKLEFILQNINFTVNSKTYDLPVTRPVYPYLIFVTADKEYRMEHTSGYSYELTETLPQKIKGYIKSPTVTSIGNEMTFGWEDNAISQGSTNDITFSNLTSGEYTISFNTFDYSASPFIIAYAINGTVMERIDNDNFKIDLSLTQGQEIKVDGIDGFEEWWIDTDFFSTDGDKLVFNPISGKYRISADFNLKYLKVEVMSGNDLAGLDAGGTGTIWIIGDSQGKPSFANSGWDPAKAICMAPMGNGKYRISFVAGKTITVNSINFVFFLAKDWSPSFGPETLTVNSDLVRIGLGQDVNGVDKGNIALAADKALTEEKTYVFVIDVSAGIDKAVLTVEER
ncbi:DUF5125 domain-containing protein [Dysgonomonas reticulitermitis]